MTNLRHEWLQDMERQHEARSFMATVTGTPGGGKVTFRRKPDFPNETQPKMAAYAPVVGDVIWVVKVGAGYLAVGKVG